MKNLFKLVQYFFSGLAKSPVFVPFVVKTEDIGAKQKKYSNKKAINKRWK